MTRILSAALAVALLLATPASASKTWAKGYRAQFSAVATCTTGTESAPSGTGDGLSLAGIHGFAVYVETGAGAMTAGGKLLAYLFNPETGTWDPVSDGTLDLTVSAVASQAFSGFAVYGGTGRIAYVPSGVGLAVHIYIVGG